MGVNIDTIRGAGVDISTAITDVNIGPSVNELKRPLMHMIDDHQLWVKSSGKEGHQLDLSGYDLRECKTLKRQKLTALKAVNAKFFGMNLFQIELQSANLEMADFRRCDLVQADMRGANLSGAKLSHANVSEANFLPLLFATESIKRFSPCDFSNAELRYTDLVGAKLKNAIFRGADLSFANLTNCDLRDADFTDAKIEGIILNGADTTGAIGAIFDKEKTGRAFSIGSLTDN
jgi:uncharacterized protein YjbI with pentapeptide repeats